MTQPLSELERQRRHYKAVRERLRVTASQPVVRAPELAWGYSGKAWSFLFRHDIEMAVFPRLFGRDVVNATCRAFGMSLSEFTSHRRQRRITRPRQAAMYVMHKHTRLALGRIGDILGGMDHSTIIHGIACVTQRPAEFAPLIAAIEAELARGE